MCLLCHHSPGSSVAQAGRAKRMVVMASAVEIPDDWTPPSIPKRKEQLDFLMKVSMGCAMGGSHRETIYSSMITSAF
eukprot:scaffold140448_cov31-Tisochrysis_lutea.AAC.4